ncbi:MAG: N-acetylmuramoyl-L-alanine amidase [Treponemataceae bacterium]|nr:N-acetylmuramoyl-L-alanine amidase [Treponemataceae bacterium]
MKHKIRTLLLCLVMAVLLPAVLSAGDIVLSDFARENGAVLYWDTMTNSGLVQKNGHSAGFQLNDQLMIIDYSQLTICEPPYKKEGVVYVSQSFADRLSELWDAPAVQGSFFRVGAILIDAGHGGKDPGAIKEQVINGKKVKVQEKDITLNAAKRLYELLKTRYPEKNIQLTRSDDRYLSLEERVEIANSVKLKENEAILFVSIHVNSNFKPEANGYEVWYLSPGYRRTVLTAEQQKDAELFPILNSMMEEEYTTESILIAKYILEGMKNSLGSDFTSRGIRQEEWFVVRNANMPSVLIELGFLTNQKEAAAMMDNEYLNKYVGGIYNGLTSFVTHFEESRGFTGL